MGGDGVTVYLAWSDAAPEDLIGPWTEAREIERGLVLLESTESLSAVYHALKHALPADTPLFVTPLLSQPKARGMAPGTTSWLRERTRGTSTGAG